MYSTSLWLVCLALVNVITSQVTSSIASCRSPPCLYFSDTTDIKSMSLSDPSAVLSVVNKLDNAEAMGVDIRRNMLFWSDADAIKSYNLSSEEIKIVRQRANSKVNGIAVEWESALLYVTDYQNEDIIVMTYDGERTKRLVTSGIRNAHGIAVDPKNGYLFWADWGLSARIQRASLSGHNQTTLYIHYSKFDMNNIRGGPTGITLDFAAKRLYWIDSEMDAIFSIDYNGGNKRRIYSLYGLDLHALNSSDVVMQGSDLYWSGPNINKTSKDTGETSLVYSEGSVKGLAVYDD